MNLNTVLLIPLIIMISSCGFHLREPVNLPEHFSPAYIQPEGVSHGLMVVLRKVAKTHNLKITGLQGSAGLNIKIIKEKKSRRVLSIDESGKAIEYGLEYEITYSVDLKDTILIEKDTIKQSRDLFFTPENLLGKNSETESLYKDMQNSVGRLMMLRIVAAATKK